jgi:transposase
MVAGVDLGLKHLAWLSVGKCLRSPGGDGSRVPEDPARPEVARHCIDQAQLAGKKDAWLAGPAAPTAPNFKRELKATMDQARALQRRKDLLRQRYGKRCRHARRYFVARREWQRCWRRVRHVHEEMARQEATRIVAACMHHGVGLLRFEDLSWSSHASKRESGSWLASWQVHWFFSQVQERTTLLARLAGIAVELVDARGTSKRCSACGVVGNRDGKRFSCTNEGCGKKVDSDLNGARNVRTASTSPRLHAKVEGARSRPLACHD